MTKEDAVKCMTGLAFRMKGGGGLMFWGVNTGYWTQNSSGKIKKCNTVGPRVAMIEDWAPVTQGSRELEIFEAKEGFITPPQWRQMVDISPVKMAVRLTKSDHYMVCLGDGTQYCQNPCANSFYKVGKGFSSYKDWSPISENNILATVKFEGDHVTFRDPRFPHGSVKGDAAETAMWIETGTSPKIEAWHREVTKEVGDLNESLARKPKVFNPIPTDIGPDFQRPLSKVRDLAPPEIIASVGPMTTALASSIQSMIELGDKETAVELAKSLSRLVNNASWHLREDRTAYAERRTKKD